MKNYFVHQSSVVDSGADIGDDTKIWHFSHISAGAVIGSRVSIGQNVFVGNKVKIGDRCKIQNNVSVYDNVTLDDDVFCGPSMVFTNVYNPRSFVERKNEFKDTYIGKGVTMGANSTIVCGVQVGKYAFIGAGALVNKNIKPFALVVGVPAKQIGWMSKFGERLDLPLEGSNQLQTCPHTGDKYLLDQDHLELV